MSISVATAAADIGPQLQQLVIKAANAFKANNGSAVEELGADVVDAVFATQVNTFFPAIPVLAPDASVDAIAARSDLELARTKMFALVAQAEAQHYATIHALKLSAAATVSKLATGALAILGGFVMTTIASGATL